MVLLIISIFVGFWVSATALPLVIRYASANNLYVELSQRKIHKKITPSMGGIGIFSGLLAAAFITSFWKLEILMIAGVLFIPFLIGLLDDRYHLRPRKKLLGQLLAATLVFFVLDVRLTSMYGIFSDAEFPQWLSYLITVFTIIILTNSFNLIDGIDGLASTFSLVALLFFGVWFSYNGVTAYALLSFALIGSVLAFLFKNWQPSKIFMGDTGSLVLGMSLSILAISFLNENNSLSSYAPMRFTSGMGTVLCVLIVPIVDTIRVIVIRIGRGISPLTADKRHIHHTLVRIGKSHRFAVLLIFVVHVFFIINALLLKHFSDWYVVGSVTLFATLLCFILDKVIARHTYGRKTQISSVDLKEHETVKL
jgi:UDP-N-acetylmuramyl pentapeptide phosphotransferase/UDP-N-acetylglucosamine-1-phosphate transferase